MGPCIYLHSFHPGGALCSSVLRVGPFVSKNRKNVLAVMLCHASLLTQHKSCLNNSGYRDGLSNPSHSVAPLLPFPSPSTHLSCSSAASSIAARKRMIVTTYDVSVKNCLGVYLSSHCFSHHGLIGWAVVVCFN